jgi:S1-C subfamily serine protease
MRTWPELLGSGIAILCLLLSRQVGASDDGRRAALIERVAPAVVRLAATSYGRESGNGTGFLVREDGIVVTNHHVVDGVLGDLYAVFHDHRRVRVLGALALDEAHDLVILRIEGTGYRVLELATADAPVAGQRVHLIGSTLGLDQSVGVGVISAIRPDGFPEQMKQQHPLAATLLGPLVQHSATSAPGASGSPLLDDQGRVVGVHHSGFTGTEVGFGAHVAALRSLLDRTNLSAAPTALRPSFARNLLVSAAVFAVLALPLLIHWVLRRRAAR